MTSRPIPTEHMRVERTTLVGADEILRRWAESVRAERAAPTNGDGQDGLLVESVSPVLAEILDAVQSGNGRAGPLRTHHAAQLGRERARQQLEVRELVREWQLLRRHIFLYLQEEATQ